MQGFIWDQNHSIQEELWINRTGKFRTKKQVTENDCVKQEEAVFQFAINILAVMDKQDGQILSFTH